MKWKAGDRVYIFRIQSTDDFQCDGAIVTKADTGKWYVDFTRDNGSKECLPFNAPTIKTKEEVIASLNQFYADAENWHCDQLQGIRKNVDIHIANIQKDVQPN